MEQGREKDSMRFQLNKGKKSSGNGYARGFDIEQIKL
jgi:hypothetical protein